jgi:outer membrane receptor for ferrienterochelin and colicins
MQKNIIKSILIFMIVTFFTLNLNLNASTTNPSSPLKGEIKGKVIDASTKKPLPGVNIFIEHTTIGAATDGAGEYHITKAPIGENIHLVASMIGYKMNHKTIQVQAEETVVANFELQPTILEMGAVVVTGTGTPHIVEDMPVRTEVIPRRLIEQKQACNLAEALAFQTGVRVENNCTNCNFSQVRILGMDGKYSQILIDGDPVMSSLAGVYGLEHFPEEMVDQIEIVKGGGSSLYGGGAIAGVINMITRRPLLNQVRIKYLNNSTDGKMDQRIGAVAETVNKEGTSGAYVFGSTRTRNRYDFNGDGYSELGDLQNESIGFKWYYRPIAAGELLTSFHRIHEERRGGNKFDLPVHEAEIAEWLEHWRSGGTVRWNHQIGPLFDYRFFYSFSVENRKSYYGGLGGDTDQDQLDALAFYGRTENPLHIGGMQANYRYRGHLLTAGLQHSRDKLVDKTSAVTAYYIDELYTNTGIFLQDDLHFGTEQQIEFVVGTRMDKHSELNNWIFSPRINGKFRLGKGVTLRGAFTTGFKPPQTYDEDLHLCGIEGDQRIVRNSNDLKEERSNSFSGGIEYQGNSRSMPLMVSFTVFQTNLKDAFAEEFVSKQTVIERWERVNSDGAEVKGVEFDMGIRPVSAAEIRCGFTYKKSQYDNPLEDFNTKNFMRTPDFSGNLRLSLDPTSKISFYAAGNYIGKADMPHEVVVENQEEPELLLVRSDSFFQLDLGLTYRLPLNSGLSAKLNLGVKNVTNVYQDDLDKGPDRDPAYVYGPIRPRTIYVGVETAF